ncbi:MAG: DUF1015 family protein [Candidatus Nanopelagicales bacterium]
MTLFAPIRGLCPPPQLAAEVAELPYDVMNRAEAIEMAAARPNSFLHVSRPDIDLPEDVAAVDPHAHDLAAAAFARMQSDGVLVRDPEPRFHVYRLTRGGHAQTGVVGGASTAAYDTGLIRRHETTRPDKQADRAAHMEALGAQTGPVFLIHRPSTAIAQALAAATSDPAPTDLVGPGGVRHEIWPIVDPATVGTLTTAFEDLEVLYIADGHHRSAAASMVHARRPTAATARFLAVAFPADEVALLPYNRLVRAAPELTPETLLAQIGQTFTVEASQGPVTPAAPGRFGLHLAGRWYVLSAPDALRTATDPADQLDVAVLGRHLLEPLLGIIDQRTDPRIGFVGGVRPLAELEAAVASGQWTAAISMYPTTVADLIAVADAGGIMPPKSTWFEPKLLDGLVSHVLD